MSAPTLSYYDQQMLAQFAQQQEAENSFQLSFKVLNHCFSACINDFTSKMLSDKENKCLERCGEKYASAFMRLNFRLQEKNAAMEGKISELKIE